MQTIGMIGGMSWASTAPGDPLVNETVRERHGLAVLLQDAAARGAQGIVLGCTEISLLVDASDAPVPLFGSVALRARAAAEVALGLA